MKNPKKIIFHGYLSMGSDKLTSIMKEVRFHIMPSVSEGQATSITHSIVNGGILPITTLACGHEEAMEGIRIDDVALEPVENAMDTAIGLSDSQWAERIVELRSRYLSSHSEHLYKKRLARALTEVIGD